MRDYQKLVNKLQAEGHMVTDLAAFEEEVAACRKRRYCDSLLHPDSEQTTNRIIFAVAMMFFLTLWLIARDETLQLASRAHIAAPIATQSVFTIIVIELVTLAVAYVRDFCVFYDVRRAQWDSLWCELLDSYIYATKQRNETEDEQLCRDLTHYLHDVGQVCLTRDMI